MKYSTFIALIVAILLSMVVSKIIYFGFTPNYAADIFNKQAFKSRLDHDVYQYRVLSKAMLYAVDDWLGKDMPAQGADARILINTNNGSQRFYLAFYYLNALFLILTAILTVLLVDLPDAFTFSAAEKTLITFLVPITIGITQFTVACYDVSSYFFQLLILYIFLRFNHRQFWGTMIAVCALLIVSTTNRESSALSVSIIAVLLLTQYGFVRKSLIAIAAMAVCFLATYVALRILVVDPQHLHIVNIQMGNLLIDTNAMGLFFWLLFFYLPMAMAGEAENRWLIGLYFLFSLPYILTCLKDGVMWEVRLYIPLLLGSLFLSKLYVSAHVLRITSLIGDLKALFQKNTAASHNR